MSFGSNVHSSELPLDKKNAFLNVFRRLKYTVLWKWEEEKLEGKPDNLILRKWLPQKEILGKFFLILYEIENLQDFSFPLNI